MRIYPEKLPNQLQRGDLAPVYLVGGDEPLLVEEAVDAIRARARQLGFTERDVLHVEPGFKWHELNDAGASLSLFAEKRLIELRLPNSKPGDAGSKALVAYTQNLPPDTVLIVITGPLDASARNSKWFKTLDKAGASIQCWPVERGQLPQWIAGRLRSRGLQPAQDAVELLAHRTEGNLLACAQDIDKLALLIEPGAPLTAALIEKTVADNARFNVFGFSDAVLAGQPARAARMLQTLRGEGVQPLPILAAIARDVRDLALLGLTGKTAGRLWPKREQQLRRALKRQSAQRWQASLPRIAQLDQLCKGGRIDGLSSNVWDELLNLSLTLAGQPASPRANTVR